MYPPIPTPKPANTPSFGSTWDPFIGIPPVGTPTDSSRSSPYVGAPGTVIMPGTAESYIGNNSNPFSGFGTALGGLLNAGVGIWDRIDQRDNQPAQVQSYTPAQASMFGGMDPTMLLLIAGGVIGAIVLLKKK